jgi:hypothetical protein
MTKETDGASAEAKLRELWAQYLERVEACDRAYAAMRPARAAFDAQVPPCPEHMLPGEYWAAQQPLWLKHNLEELSTAWTVASDERRMIRERILAERADGLFAIGAKLAALAWNDPDKQHHEEAIASVLGDIDRMIGTEFASVFQALAA